MGDDDSTKICKFIIEHYPPIPNLFTYSTDGKSVPSSLQERFDALIALKEGGTHFNDRLAKNKEYRNPNIYFKLLEFAELDESTTNIDVQYYDPHALKSLPSYKEIAALQKEKQLKR